ncbi:hypothetical protein ACRPHS_08380 [Pantoea allii]|uniref:alanine acetyltransferase n=1 Tax=Pantoea allii TaxID=574096 RepID=UPI0020B8ECE3|nr:alanine acetyltransferase [Pantoea allii]
MQRKMKAMVYHGGNDIRVEERVRPTVMEATDAIIKLTKTTICGTDPGIWKGKNRRLMRQKRKRLAILMAGF